MMTASVDALPDIVKAGALLEVAGSTTSRQTMIPHGEHYFGSRTFFWNLRARIEQVAERKFGL